jgi:hypothetical protein
MVRPAILVLTETLYAKGPWDPLTFVITEPIYSVRQTDNDIHSSPRQFITLV